MWQRRDLKASARGGLRHNYWNIVLACLLIGMFVGGFGVSGSYISHYSNERYRSSRVESEHRQQLREIDSAVNSCAEPLYGRLPVRMRNMTGYMKTDLANTVWNLESGWRAAEKVKNSNTPAKAVRSLAMAALGILWLLFGKYMLVIGERRFFLENIRYRKTGAGRLLFLYKERKLWNPARVMLIKDIFLFLWSLTVAGFFIKHYSYRMVPYILAENPSAGWREAITLSRQMMDGNKWKSFLLDLSFWYWVLLGFLSGGIFSLLFVRPYFRSAEAGLYRTLRKEALETSPSRADLFNDQLLFESGEAAGGVYTGPAVRDRRPITIDYRRKYSLLNLILLFFTFSIVGWVWEVTFHFIRHGVLVDRGLLHGPWLPIYGFGAMIALVALKRFRDRPPLLFALLAVISGIMEYMTSWLLEKTLHVRMWDYSSYKFNIGGRVSIYGVMAFAVIGIIAVYILAPALDGLYSRVPKRIRIIAAVVLLAALTAAAVYTHGHPNYGRGKTYAIPKSDVRGSITRMADEKVPCLQMENSEAAPGMPACRSA